METQSTMPEELSIEDIRQTIAEKKRVAAKERKRASRLAIKDDPERRQDALDNDKKYSKKYFDSHKKKQPSSAEKAPCKARNKWDKAYADRKRDKSATDIQQNSKKPSNISWFNRPQEQRDKYNNNKLEKRQNETILNLQLQLQQSQEAEKLSTNLLSTQIHVSKQEKQRFLIDKITMDAKFVEGFSDDRLSYIYLEMLERSKELSKQNLHPNEIITTIAAEKLCEAGSMAGGAGFFAMEACTAEASRECVFPAEEMVRVTVETSCNLSNIGHVAECQKNLENNDLGFMFKKTTITQAGLDAAAGINFFA